MMMMLDDDEEEPQLEVVDNYHFVDGEDTPVSFHVLPFQFDGTDKVPPCKKDVFLHGSADRGLQKVYKKVVAWKLGLDGEQPDVSVLSSEGNWIGLLKPRNSYEATIRTILITVQMLHFLRRNPAESEKSLWDHLCEVFDKFEVRPLEDDLRSHNSLIKLFADRDPTLATSQILQGLVGGKSWKKIEEVNSSNLDMKQPFIAADVEEIDEMSVADAPLESDDDDEKDLFDSVCAICDNGGELLCCEGPCMRSFHATKEEGKDTDCAGLGFTAAQVQAIQNYLCKNCEYKQHQCFVCGELDSSDGPSAKVFLCNNATCGHFYHPKCVAPLLRPGNRNAASELEKKIASGMSFTCPVHWCSICKKLEDRTEEELQFAVCRRCPTSYHRKCLPKEITFAKSEEEEEDEDEEVLPRAWEDLLPDRILIYCLKHDLIEGLGTPVRDHIKFPGVTEMKKRTGIEEKAKKKKRTSDHSYVDQRPTKSAKLSEKLSRKGSEQAKRIFSKSSTEQVVLKSEKKKVKPFREKLQPEPSKVESSATSPKSVREQERQLATSSSFSMGKIARSSFPVVDSETERRIIALVKKETSSLTLQEISKKCIMPLTHANSGKHIEKTIQRGKIERSVQAVQAALSLLENEGTVEDAKAVCEPEVLRQLAKWNSKLRVYLAPFIHGMRYTSFGRHFTKVDKLVEIVDKLHWYVQPGDMIVDFCCGANDFSRLMNEKLEKVGKKCNFKNYDVIQPKNNFCFEKRDWMSVQPKELPRGSQLIMGLNPPFGVKAGLANRFIDKALTFKPKLIILIVPKETERLDRKRTPYDLIWEDNQSLSGKSFYLPGSVDTDDKQMDQWNASPPPLYLWSRRDFTDQHMRIAEKRGHTSILENVPHAEEKEGNQLDDFPVERLTEAAYEHNLSGKEEVTGREESKSFDAKNRKEKVTGWEESKSSDAKNRKERVTGWEESKSSDAKIRKEEITGKEESKSPDAKNRKERVTGREESKNSDAKNRKEKVTGWEESKSSGAKNRRTPDQVDSLPPEKQVEVAYEERKAIPNSKNTSFEDARDVRRKGRIDTRGKDVKSSWPDEKWKAPEVSNGKFTKRGEPKKPAEVPDVKEESDMSISNQATGNARNESMNYSSLVPREFPLERRARQDSIMSYPEPEPNESPFKRTAWQGTDSSHPAPEPREPPTIGRATHPDSHLRTSTEHGAEPAGQHSPTFSTDNARLYNADVSELVRRYGASPTSGAMHSGDAYNLPSGPGGSYSRMRSSEDQYGNYTMDRSADAARSSPGDDYFNGYGQRADADVRAQVRLYGGQSMPLATDVREHVRMYGGQGTGAYNQSRQSFGASDSRLGQSALTPSSYGFSPSSVGRSAMDKYAPRLDETNYTPRSSLLDPSAAHQARSGPYNVHGYQRDMPPDHRSFASRQQYPNPPPPGSSSGWLDN